MRLIYFIVIRITFKNNVVKNLLWRFEVVHFHSNSVFLSILHASLHLLVHLLLLYLRSLLAFMTLYFKLFRCLEALSLRILSSKKTRVKVNQIGINLETRKKAPSWKIIRLLSYNLITWAQWILEVFLNTQWWRAKLKGSTWKPCQKNLIDTNSTKNFPIEKGIYWTDSNRDEKTSKWSNH